MANDLTDFEPILLTEDQQINADPAFVEKMHIAREQAENGTPMSADDAIAWLRDNL